MNSDNGSLARANSRITNCTGIALAALAVLIAGGFPLLQSATRPFWFDEVCTAIICRLPGNADIWKALTNAADTNPPLFYYICRFMHSFVANEQLAYRLPSILGLCITVACIYKTLVKRVDRLSALAGAAFVLCTPMINYAHEARPYALMVGTVAIAIVAWQRVAKSAHWPILLSVALALSVSLHYYAIFAWPAFIVAEGTVWATGRRFRTSVWVALAAGGLPLLVYTPLLASIRHYYGGNFWAPVRVAEAFEVYDWLFSLAAYRGFALTLAVTVSFVYWVAMRQRKRVVTKAVPGEDLRVEEGSLACMLLLLPVTAVLVSEITHSGMADRYMLPTVLGAALIVGFLTSRWPAKLRALALAVMLTSYGLNTIRDTKTILSDLLYRRQPVRMLQALNLTGVRNRDPNLPIIISSGLEFLPMAYYDSSEEYPNVYALVDRQAAIAFAKTDSVDCALLALKRYFPLQVQDYRQFALQHHEFFLVSAGMFDWWPSRLAHDGNLLRLLSNDGDTRIYKVTLQG